MSENELRPCPFCPDGGDVQLVTFTGSADDIDDVVHCHACGTILKHKIWQTRPIEDALNKRIAELVSSNMVMAKGVLDLKARIAELEEKQRWIPVSEGLPEAYTRVLACSESGYMEVDYRTHFCRVDVGIAEFYSLDNVTHWMPLPPNPEVQE